MSSVEPNSFCNESRGSIEICFPNLLAHPPGATLLPTGDTYNIRGREKGKGKESVERTVLSNQLSQEGSGTFP